MPIGMSERIFPIRTTSPAAKTTSSCIVGHMALGTYALDRDQVLPEDVRLEHLALLGNGPSRFAEEVAVLGSFSPSRVFEEQESQA